MIEIQAATAHEPNVETLAGHEVLAHRRMTFHPRTCGLRRCIDVVAATLIGYVDVRVAVGTNTRRR
jgi:hypothetical protein